MGTERMTDQERRRLRQRLIEVLAAEGLGVSKGARGGWGGAGRVPHHPRITLMQLGEEVGLAVEAPADFEGWMLVGARCAPSRGGGCGSRRRGGWASPCPPCRRRWS